MTLALLHSRARLQRRKSNLRRALALAGLTLLPGAAAAQEEAPATNGFYTLTPCRVVDTRNPSGPWGGPAISANTTRVFTLAGQCGIPSTANSVALNITAVDATSGGSFRVYPAGYPLPNASAINYFPGKAKANNAQVGLGANGDLAVRCDQISGSVNLIIDVNGYFRNPATPPPPTPTPPPPSGNRWSRRYGAGEDDRTLAVAVDGSGRVVVTGYFDGTTDFGGGQVSSYVHPNMGPTIDIFIAEYSPTGGYLWARTMGADSTENGKAVATDGSGNVLLAGYQNSFQVDYGGGPRSTQGGSDIFVAKYSSAGAHVWSKTAGGYGNDSGNGVAADGAGNVILTGGMDLSSIGVNFGGGALQSAGFQDIFVVKYSSTGAHVWSKRFGGTLTDAGVAVDTDASGNIYVTGNFEGTISFGGGNLSSAGAKDVFVAKLDPSGNHVWSKRFGGSSNDFAGGIAVDSAGDVAISGRFVGTVNFGGGNLTSAGGEDGYLAKLSGASGNHVWSKRFGGTSNDNAAGVAVDGSNNVAVTGQYNGSVDFGGGPLASLSIDAFAAKYTASGAHVWSRRYGDSNYQFGTAVGASPGGDVVLGGYFNYNVDFGTGTMTSSGGSTFDAFAAAIGP